MIGADHPLSPPYPVGQEIPPDGCAFLVHVGLSRFADPSSQTRTSLLARECGPPSSSPGHLCATSRATIFAF